MSAPVKSRTGFDHYFKAGYTMKDWICHIFKAFNCSYETVELKWHEDSERYSVASVKRIFPKCDRLTIDIMNPQFEEVTRTFLANSIELYGNGLNDPHVTQEFQKILIRNFSFASLDHMATLNTILMTNSKCLDIFSKLTYKEANRLLKLWARGAMPSLKHFSSSVSCAPESVEETIEAIFKGIEHRRSIEQVNCQECESIRDGGFVISRVGGTRATVNIYTKHSDEGYVLFEIFVKH